MITQFRNFEGGCVFIDYFLGDRL